MHDLQQEQAEVRLFYLPELFGAQIEAGRMMSDLDDDDDDEICTCDIDGADNCPAHYPIDDGTDDDDDDCMDCGVCDSCIERTKAAFEEEEARKP